jgi:hypothetical protein
LNIPRRNVEHYGWSDVSAIKEIGGTLSAGADARLNGDTRRISLAGYQS